MNAKPEKTFENIIQLRVSVPMSKMQNDTSSHATTQEPRENSDRFAERRSQPGAASTDPAETMPKRKDPEERSDVPRSRKIKIGKLFPSDGSSRDKSPDAKAAMATSSDEAPRRVYQTGKPFYIDGFSLNRNKSRRTDADPVTSSVERKVVQKGRQLDGSSLSSYVKQPVTRPVPEESSKNGPARNQAPVISAENDVDRSTGETVEERAQGAETARAETRQAHFSFSTDSGDVCIEVSVGSATQNAIVHRSGVEQTTFMAPLGDMYIRLVGTLFAKE